MMNKKLLTSAVATAFIAGAGLAQAQEADDRDAASGSGFEISGNVALTSDYRFRGISQSDTSAAIQGGFDAEFSPGFYIGTWGSSVDFDSNDGYDGPLASRLLFRLAQRHGRDHSAQEHHREGEVGNTHGRD